MKLCTCGKHIIDGDRSANDMTQLCELFWKTFEGLSEKVMLLALGGLQGLAASYSLSSG